MLLLDFTDFTPARRMAPHPDHREDYRRKPDPKASGSVSVDNGARNSPICPAAIMQKN
jgi:hypothetical protein